MVLGEAGWTPDQWGYSRFRSLSSSADGALNQKRLTAFMRSLLKASVIKLFGFLSDEVKLFTYISYLFCALTC